MADNFDDLFPEKPPRKRKTKTETALDNAVEKIQTIADTPAHSKSTGWSESDIETITAGIALLFLEGTRFISMRVTNTEALAMQDDESEVISKAASRIVLRHIKIAKGKRGDVTDGMTLAVAMAAYGMRSYDTFRRIRSEKTEISNAHPNNGGSYQTIGPN